MKLAGTVGILLYDRLMPREPNQSLCLVKELQSVGGLCGRCNQRGVRIMRVYVLSFYAKDIGDLKSGVSAHTRLSCDCCNYLLMPGGG